MRVRVYTSLLARLLYGRKLREMRFYPKKDESGRFFQRHIDDKDRQTLRAVKRYCRHRLLRCSISDDRMIRSSNYRNIFFKNNAGIFGGGEYYLCAYCGKLLTRKKVRVDHIIPVYLAVNSMKYRRILNLKGIKTVNDPRNLTASCAKCNGRKSSDGGIWVIKGYFGRLWYRVVFRELIALAVGGMIFYLLFTILVSSGLYDRFSGIIHHFI